MRLLFQLTVERDEDGTFIVSCPVLEGCHSHGRTLEEALQNVREAICAHLEARRLLGEAVPHLEMVDVEL